MAALRWIAALAGLMLVLAACETGLGPDRGQAWLVVQPSFAQQESEAIDGHDPALRVNNVRVIVIDPAGDTVVDNVAEWPVDQDTLRLEVAVEVTGDETFEFILQGREGTELLFEAVIPDLNLSAGASEPTVVQPVLRYAGPEARIATLTIDAPGAVLLAGDQVALEAVGTTTNGTEITDPLMVWRSLDTLAATVDSTGAVRVKHDAGREAVIVGRVAFRSLADTLRLPIVPDTLLFQQTPDTLTALARSQTITVTGLGVGGDTVRNVSYTWAVRDTSVLYPTLRFPGPSQASAFARSNGTSFVVVNAGPFTDSVAVTVDQRATAIAPVPTYTLLAIGDTAALTVAPLDAGGSPVADADPASWSSSNSLVADVGATTGIARALSAMGAVGSAELTATLDLGSFSVWVDVVDGTSAGPATAMGVGDFHNCWIEGATSGVYCRGGNEFGALGDGGTVSSDTAVAVLNGFLTTPTYTQVTSGGLHSCAVADTGGGTQAFCWGDNRFGQIGDGSTLDRLQATPVNTSGVGGDLTAVETGGVHTCGLDATGAAYCWGYNLFGQLGNANAGPAAGTSVPVAVAGGHSFTELAIGWLHTCGLKADGSVWCWGRGGEGQLGTGTLMEAAVVPVQVSGPSFTTIEAGAAHTCGLTAAGAVYCWGYNSSGQAGVGTTTFEIAEPTLLVFPSAITAVDLAMGQIHGCALASAGAVYCWGANDQLQLGQALPRVTRNPIAVPLSFLPSDIAGGGGLTCGIDGTRMLCWGGLPRDYLGRDGLIIPPSSTAPRLPEAFSLR